LSGATKDWTLTIVPRIALDLAEPGYDRTVLDRLRTMIDATLRELELVRDDVLYYALPIRSPEFRVTGMIEVSRSIAYLKDAWHEDVIAILPVYGSVLGLMILAIIVFARRLVTRPIDKLIAGIDDVAQGDLSRVLLSEREDEIGALASRFNEMTHSLRESKAETKRQNEAKMQLEEQLSQTEKLATIGQLAAEIAHEVGTPLNVIAGRARSLGKKASDPEAVSKNATIIAEQATRITRIIQRLLDFARRKVGTIERERVNLNEVTLTTMDFLDSKFKAAKVKTSLDRQEGLPPVKGLPDQLQQVLINLLLNAVEAMDDGGRVAVETATETRKRPGLELAPAQPYVRVSIRDSGPGIPEEHRDKIFEPFYTSKDGEGGTGLGLAVSHGIIKEHDGWIEIDEAPGGGSIFSVWLPVVDRHSGEHQAVQGGSPS
jgi:signal transduction histidine kinase